MPTPATWRLAGWLATSLHKLENLGDTLPCLCHLPLCHPGLASAMSWCHDAWGCMLMNELLKAPTHLPSRSAPPPLPWRILLYAKTLWCMMWHGGINLPCKNWLVPQSNYST